VAAYRFYINRLLTLPLTQKEKDKEWKTILKIASNNGYTSGTIVRLKQQTIKRLEEKDQNITNNNTSKVIWATFTYHGGYIRGITNIFRDTRIRTAYRATNTTLGMLRNTKRNRDNDSGIYKLTCNTCQGVYIGQTGRTTDTRYKEHVRYIRSNNPQSAYALHILNNRHEYGTKEQIMELIKVCSKGKLMKCWESMYIQEYHRKGHLITE